MPWLFLFVALSTAAILLLGTLAVRVFLEARRLGLQVDESARRFAAAAEALERAAVPVAEHAGRAGR
ncbi:hypothetical protein ACFW9F_12200 [Streptomyces sp. NPDC059506]|uniref:Uncharacterized protein n=1 Tax=Streptomyces thermolineatus TaxID=44033 RepID=A0ABP5YNM1_9ACTN|nr:MULTISPECIES: hypothetical protein [unclassified Streptomyces]MCZ2527213.1 hypothetical protein [Streptomyces sp. HB2AG]PLW73158.1 hypothetical protein C0036_08760 [Streptomyces sp. DJ]QMV24149.1 hypothetical protein GQS52_22885 [Streptomyces sp. SCUT-3]